MQLHGIERHEAGDTGDVLSRLVHEHADGRDKSRQRPDNRAHAVGIDEARTLGPENESERVGPSLDRSFGIVDSRDTTNLHQHRIALL